MSEHKEELFHRANVLFTGTLLLQPLQDLTPAFVEDLRQECLVLAQNPNAGEGSVLCPKSDIELGQRLRAQASLLLKAAQEVDLFIPVKLQGVYPDRDEVVEVVWIDPVQQREGPLSAHASLPHYPPPGGTWDWSDLSCEELCGVKTEF